MKSQKRYGTIFYMSCGTSQTLPFILIQPMHQGKTITALPNMNMTIYLPIATEKKSRRFVK
jgi:hypothetical protein